MGGGLYERLAGGGLYETFGGGGGGGVCIDVWRGGLYTFGGGVV